jgi:glutaredoxin 3
VTAQPEVLVYGNASCPYCGAARMLLTRKAIKFRDIDVSNDADAYTKMQQRSGSRTVPQIFIGDTHVGGFDELNALEKRGELDPMLRT